MSSCGAEDLSYNCLLELLTGIQGGHFAALEQPEAFLEDMEEFIAKLNLGVET